ncbi:MAG: PAS domain-containing protein [Burkholderiales bacterium]|nr:PAS domain-containing protein [Burkholderiales bacterium]
MSSEASPGSIDATEEISALVEALSAADQRLEFLTGGQVDAVVTRAGRTVMLQRSQELLRRQEALQQAAILDSLPAGLVLLDVRGAIVSVNEAWRRFARENALPGNGGGLGMKFLEVCSRVLGGDSPLAQAMAAGVRSVLAGEHPSYVVEFACDAPPAQRWYLLTISPIGEKRPSAAVVTQVDITERMMAQLSMQRSAELLTAVVSGTPDHVFVKDREGRYLLCNDAFAHFVGSSVEEMIGRTNQGVGLIDRAILTADAALQRSETDRRVMSSGEPISTEDLLTGAAGPRTFLATKAPYRNERGEVVGVIGISRDITERKAAEHATRLLADRLASILGSITDGFLTLDRDWNLTFVNNEALRILGREEDELIGRSLWAEFPEMAKTQLGRGLRLAMSARSGNSFEAYHAPWSAWIGVHCYPSKVGLSVYFSDVTQRRRDQDALRGLNSDLEARVLSRTAELTLAREDAEQANRAKSSFLAAMSHEIRTPMNGVVGMIDVLEQSSLKGPQADVVRTIRESAYALLSIVDDVLDFSKIEAGHFHIDREPMSVERVAAQVRDTLAHLAQSKGVDLNLAIGAHLPAHVLGDALRLRQILLNLVGNAIKFSSTEGRVGKVDVALRVHEAGARNCTVEFVVADDGIGMDEATLALLFQPFVQADVSTTRRFGGTGLGLSISGRIAELMGGRIEVASRSGHGSRFTLRLPFESVDPPSVAEPPPGAAEEFDGQEGPDSDHATMPMPLSALGAVQGGRLILVAEDNETNQKVICKQLDLMGYASHVATTGREALALWRAGSYALLLTDLHMPAMDGFELAAAIRGEEGPDVRLPVIALTANAAKSEIQRCSEVGMDDHMTKPLQLADLHAMLQRWMPPGAQPRALRGTRPAAASTHAPLARLKLTTPSSVVDLAVLSALVGSDPVVITRMLASFRSSAARAREAVRSGVSSGTCGLVGDAVHALKSASRSIGALHLAEICDEMEVSANSGRRAELSAQLVRFEQAFADVHRFLDAR